MAKALISKASLPNAVSTWELYPLFKYPNMFSIDTHLIVTVTFDRKNAEINGGHSKNTETNDNNAQTRMEEPLESHDRHSEQQYEHDSAEMNSHSNRAETKGNDDKYYRLTRQTRREARARRQAGRRAE